MMGHREHLSGGDEFDAFSPTWRRMLNWRRGELKKVKRTFAKRARKETLEALRLRPED
jgi:hypothetical protein